MTKKKFEESRTLPVMHRFVPMDVVRAARADGEDTPQLYDMSVSSEAEVQRWFGIEILDHSPGAIDMSRMRASAPVLVDHFSDQVGVVRNVKLDGDSRKLRASVQFSKNARGQEIERDVADNIRSNVSIGYRVISMKQVEMREGGVPVYKVTRWQPLEVSIVAVPADSTVGINRSGADDEEFPVELQDTEGRSMLWNRKFSPDGGGGGEGAAAPAAAATAAAAPAPVVTRDRQKEAVEIMEMCDANGMAARAVQFVRDGLHPDAVARELLKIRTSNGTAPQPGSESVEAIAGKKEAKRYSYARAILLAANEVSGGLEAEVSQEFTKRMAGVKNRGGVMIPMRLSDVGARPMELRENHVPQTRTLDSKTIGKGVEVVPDIQGDLIELLRNRAFVLQLGARLLTGLSQPISFPRQTGPLTTFWVAENSGTNVTASDPALGLATLVPKTLQATTAYSRQFLNMATIDVEGWIRDELAIVHALAIDRAAIHGLGSNGEPVGIYKQTGTQTESFAGPVGNFGHLVNMQTAIAVQNALAGSLGYLMPPGAAGKLKQALVASAAGSAMIWDGPFDGGTVAGYKALATNQCFATMTNNDYGAGSEYAVVFGNWMDMIVGLFAAMEIIVDPYALKKQGVIEVTSFQMCDILLRHPESFCKSNGAT